MFYNHCMKSLTLISLLFAATAAAQTPVCPVASGVSFQVHYLGADTIQAKYGRKLPKSIFAGSVTGINCGADNLTIGQGMVLQTLRANGFNALSQQDARAIVLRAQGSGVRGFWNHYSPVGVKIIDDINNLQIFKVIQLPLGTSAALVTAGAIAKAVQVDVSQVIADIYQQYDADGVQSIMQLGPGGSLVGTLLFEPEAGTPHASPKAGTDSQVFTIQIPVAK